MCVVSTVTDGWHHPTWPWPPHNPYPFPLPPPIIIPAPFPVPIPKPDPKPDPWVPPVLPVKPWTPPEGLGDDHSPRPAAKPAPHTAPPAIGVNSIPWDRITPKIARAMLKVLAAAEACDRLTGQADNCSVSEASKRDLKRLLRRIAARKQ